MVTVIGEALVDIIVDRGGEVTSVVGGAPLNTARAIARLGVPATFVGGVSTDAFGDRIARLMDADRVLAGLPQRVDAPTTLAIAALDDGGAATYRFLVDGTSAAAVTPELALAAVPDAPGMLHVGTLGLVLKPLVDATRAVVAAADPATLVMVDPNCRPALLADAAGYRAVLDEVLARADVVKVSGDDLAFLHPGLASDAAAERLHAESGAVVLFTDGAAAVHVLTAEERVVIDVPRVPVVDTVGAGDSFGGGFLAWWAREGLTRDDLVDGTLVARSAHFGIQVAGITCQRAGADPPWAHELVAAGIGTNTGGEA